MKIKTSELSGAALDWAVAKCEGMPWPDNTARFLGEQYYRPSTEWAHGGPIIERDGISISHCKHGLLDVDAWWATTGPTGEEETMGLFGPTPLTAAMRCKVASKLGDVVETPVKITTTWARRRD